MVYNIINFKSPYKAAQSIKKYFVMYEQPKNKFSKELAKQIREQYYLE